MGKLLRFYLVFAVIVVVSMGLFAIAFHGRDIYEYHVGTPTKATVDRCDTHGRHPTCYGTWSIGGRSQTGPIHGADKKNDPVGSTLDVHVSGGTAYTAPGASYLNILFSTLFTALIAFGAWKGITRMFGGSRRTPPGWYPDPSGAQAQRYWDGRQWI